MLRRYFPAAFAIAIDALAIAAASAILALAYWVATGAHGDYLALIANVLFLEGGIILGFGAVIELLKLKGTEKIYQALHYPQRWLGVPETEIEEAADESQGSAAGWTLILIGATLIAFSIMASFDYLL